MQHNEWIPLETCRESNAILGNKISNAKSNNKWLKGGREREWGEGGGTGTGTGMLVLLLTFLQ